MKIITTITTGLATVGGAYLTLAVENHNLVIRSEMDEITKQIHELRAQRANLKSQLIEA
jgi:Golgi nucleoside diphosphatase